MVPTFSVDLRDENVHMLILMAEAVFPLLAKMAAFLCRELYIPLQCPWDRASMIVLKCADIGAIKMAQWLTKKHSLNDCTYANIIKGALLRACKHGNAMFANWAFITFANPWPQTKTDVECLFMPSAVACCFLKNFELAHALIDKAGNEIARHSTTNRHFHISWTHTLELAREMSQNISWIAQFQWDAHSMFLKFCSLGYLETAGHMVDEFGVDVRTTLHAYVSVDISIRDHLGKFHIVSIKSHCPELSVCAAHGHLNILKWLYRRFDFYYTENDFKRDVLPYARQNGHEDIVRWVCNLFPAA